MKKLVVQFVMVFSLFLLAVPLSAESLTSEKIVDAAFEKYIDNELLGIAAESADPSLMIDLALQLADGEKVLLRPHRAISSGDMFRNAARIAASTGDEECVQRIKLALNHLKNEELQQEIDTMINLGTASRSSAPTPPKFEFVEEDAEKNKQAERTVSGLLSSIEESAIQQNRDAIDETLQRITEDKSLPEAMGREIANYATKVKDTIPEKADPATEALAMLTGYSRTDSACDIVPNDNIYDTYFSPRMRATFIESPNGGARLVELKNNSPLRGRMQKGDVITDLDGIPVVALEQLESHYRNTQIDYLRHEGKPFQQFRRVRVWLGW